MHSLKLYAPFLSDQWILLEALFLISRHHPTATTFPARYGLGEHVSSGDVPEMRTHLDTQAIQKEIDACEKAGGGTFIFPPGTHRAGTLYLRSNVTLHLPATATLCQSKDMADYDVPPAGSYAYGSGSRHVFLHGDRVHNVALVGEGTIDGNLAFDTSRGAPHGRGPLPVLFENSRDVRIEGITLRNSPSFAITFFGCRKVDVIGVQCLDSQADGINPVCSQEVTFDDVLIEGSKDDPIAIKNEMSGAAPDCGFLTENLVVKNSTIRHCGHPAVKIGTGTFGIFRNIVFSHCIFESTGAMLTIQLMSPEREDVPERAIEDVSFTNIELRDVSGLIDVTSLVVNRPIIRNIRLANIDADGLKGRSAIWGSPEAPIENVTLRNIRVRGSSTPVRYWYSDMLEGSAQPPPYWLKTRHVHGLKLHDVDLLLEETESGLICEDGTNVAVDELILRDVAGKARAGPVVTLDRVKDVSIRDSTGPASRTFLRVKGEATAGVRLERCDWSEGTPLDVESDLSREAVGPSAGNVSYSALDVNSQIRANEGFSATVTVANDGVEGFHKAELQVDRKVVGTQWLWLEEKDRRAVSLETRPYYLPGSYTISAGELAATADVRPSPAAFGYGERMKIDAPAAAGELTVVTIPLKNIGGALGNKEVKLVADGETVASTTVTLAPGEQKDVTIEHRFPEAGPHRLEVGDFPAWPYATFANCPASFYQTHEKIIIEAGGGEHQVREPDRQYAAIYLRGVKGDFVATTTFSVRHVTGPYCGSGLIVKNDLADPADNAGCVIDWFYPKYAVCHYEDAQHRQISKEGKTFTGLIPVSPEDADAAQDVGLFVHAFSASQALCHIEIDHLTVYQQA